MRILHITSEIDQFLSWKNKFSQNYYFPIFHVGCSLSHESAAIYEKRDANEVNMVKTIFWTFFSLVFFSYLPTIICWLMTITLGFPSSEYWAIPLDTDSMYVTTIFCRKLTIFHYFKENFRFFTIFHIVLDNFENFYYVFYIFLDNLKQNSHFSKWCILLFFTYFRIILKLFLFLEMVPMTMLMHRYIPNFLDLCRISMISFIFSHFITFPFATLNNEINPLWL